MPLWKILLFADIGAIIILLMFLDLVNDNNIAIWFFFFCIFGLVLIGYLIYFFPIYTSIFYSFVFLFIFQTFLTNSKSVNNGGGQ